MKYDFTILHDNNDRFDEEINREMKLRWADAKSPWWLSNSETMILAILHEWCRNWFEVLHDNNDRFDEEVGLHVEVHQQRDEVGGGQESLMIGQLRNNDLLGDVDRLLAHLVHVQVD